MQSYYQVTACLDDSFPIQKKQPRHPSNSSHPVFHSTTASVKPHIPWPPPQQPGITKDHQHRWHLPWQTPGEKEVHQHRWPPTRQSPGKKVHQHRWQPPRLPSGEKAHQHRWPDPTTQTNPTAAPSQPPQITSMPPPNEPHRTAQNKLASSNHLKLPDNSSENTEASKAAAQRNATRFEEEQEINKKLLGTYIVFKPQNSYLTNNISKCLPAPIHLPQPDAPPDHKMLSTIQHILRQPSVVPNPPPFSFEVSTKAAEKNTTILETHGFDLTKTLTAYDRNTTTPGSEFRDVNLLRPLLQRHPLWTVLHRILTKGAEIFLDHDPDDDQQNREEKHSTNRLQQPQKGTRKLGHHPGKPRKRSETGFRHGNQHRSNT
jgi:hypothetical protein